jgi:hypothetical protein
MQRLAHGFIKGRGLDCWSLRGLSLVFGLPRAYAVGCFYAAPAGLDLCGSQFGENRPDFLNQRGC